MLTKKQLIERLKDKLSTNSFPYGDTNIRSCLNSGLGNNLERGQELRTKRTQIELILKRLENRTHNLTQAKAKLKEIDESLITPAGFRCPHCNEVLDRFTYSQGCTEYGTYYISEQSHCSDDTDGSGDIEYSCPECDEYFEHSDIEEYLR